MSSLSHILTFDCAMGHCSAALALDGNVVERELITERNRQTRELVPMLERLLKKQHVEFAALQGIGTTYGPGSFTGIRIGLATAQALAYAANLPLYTVTTLELLAWQCWHEAGEPEASVITLINAYRGEFYAQRFTGADSLKAAQPPALLKKQDIPSLIGKEEGFLLAGDAESLLKESDIPFLPSTQTIQIPCAAALADYICRFTPPPTDGGKLAPFYLREPDAKPQAAFGSHLTVK